MEQRFLGFKYAFLCATFILSACGPLADGLKPTQTGRVETPSSAAPISTSQEQNGPSCFDSDLLCVGFMTDGGELDDGAFYEAVWAGIERSRVDLAARVTYTELKDSGEYEAEFQIFANAGYDIVVTAGYGLLLPTLDAAERYPAVQFIGIDQDQLVVSENLSGVGFSQEKAGFLAGVLAGSLTKSDTIGAILGTVHSPTYRGYRKGFEAGVKGVNPQAKVIVLYHPGGIADGQDDPLWGSKAAQFMLDNQADVVFAAGGRTAAGALTHIAQTSAALCIGADIDQFLALPEAQGCLISSAVRDVEQEVFISIASAAIGLGAREFEGSVELAPFHKYDRYIQADVKLFFDNLTSELAKDVIPTDGSYRISKPPEIVIPQVTN